MKKSIVAIVSVLFLCLIFPTSLLADDLSPEQRANLQDQFSSIPIGEEDPWGEAESVLNPEDDNIDPNGFTILTSDVSISNIDDAAFNLFENTINSLIDCLVNDFETN